MRGKFDISLNISNSFQVIVPDFDPVRAVAAGHHSLQVVSANVVGRLLVDLLRHLLQEAHRDVPDHDQDTKHDS